MAAKQYSRARKYKILALVAGITILGLLVAVYVGYRLVMRSPEKLIAYIAEDAKLSLGKIQQTATRDGKIEWRLDAISARYLEDDRQVQLDELVVTFFTDSGQEVRLSATDGILNTESNDIEVSGAVEVKNKAYTLKTTRLQYQHEDRVIYTTAPVVIHRRNGGQLSADTLHFDLEANKLLLKGNVRGEFPEQQPAASSPG
jgi:LPS export ABC transporter protein LptC